MMQIEATRVKDLRDETGAPMMDCKKALTEADGDLELARVLLRKAGLAQAGSRSQDISEDTMNQKIAIYLHHDKKSLGMITHSGLSDEVATHICQQIVAMKPEYLKKSDVPQELIDQELDIIKAGLKVKLEMLEQIAQGKLNKDLFQRVVLEEQKFFLDNSMTIGQYVKKNHPEGEILDFKRFSI